MTKYKLHNKYILRSPVYPLVESNRDFDDLSCFNNMDDFLNRVAIASPQLYQEYKKWIDFGGKSKKEEEKLLLGLAKYFLRTSMRCTPFGLFSGIAVGNLEDKTNIKISELESHIPKARLDLHILDSLLTELQNNRSVRKRLKYYPNDSLYKVGEKYIYFESHNINGEKKFDISSVDSSVYLDDLIDKAKHGSSIIDLVNFISNNDITPEEAHDFINDVIDSQILVSDLQSCVTGDDLLSGTLAKIQNVDSIRPMTMILNKVNQRLEEFKSCRINDAYSRTSEICKYINEIFDSVNEQYVCNFDLVLNTSSNYLDSNIEDELRDGLSILNRLTPYKRKSEIERFKEEFYLRYEQQLVPLLKVFDFNSGIKYPLNSPYSFSENNPLIDDLKVKRNITEEISVRWGKLESLMLKKYVNTVKDTKLVCEFSEKDLDDFKESWNDLPDTFSVKTKIVESEGKRWILIDSVSGASAINLISRFAHADRNIKDLVNEIAKIEKELSRNEILAEIVHLPDNRDGNIISRTNFRDYEITFLTQSTVDSQYRLPVSDLYLKLENDELILWSKKLESRIIPYLSCAHNYNYKSMPIYKFLCDIQTQGIRRYLDFDWGLLGTELTFLPRITYKNIIISLATWHINYKEIINLISTSNSDQTIENIRKFRKENKIPQKVVLVQGDNELLIDLNKISSINILLSSIKSYPMFVLKEFIFEIGDSPVVDSKGNSFANEFIFSYYKN